MYVSICFEFDKFFFNLTSFAYVKKKGGGGGGEEKLMSSTSNVYMD